MALHLPELHRLAPQVVVQLHCEDGRCSALILRTLLACRRETFAVKRRRCNHEPPHRNARNIFHRSDSAEFVGLLSHSVFHTGKSESLRILPPSTHPRWMRRCPIPPWKMVCLSLPSRRLQAGGELLGEQACRNGRLCVPARTRRRSLKVCFCCATFNFFFYFLCKICRELAWSFACLDWSLLADSAAEEFHNTLRLFPPFYSPQVRH